MHGVFLNTFLVNVKNSGRPEQLGYTGAAYDQGPNCHSLAVLHTLTGKEMDIFHLRHVC